MDLPPRRGACCAVDQDNGLAYFFRGYHRGEMRYLTGYEQYISTYNFNTGEWCDRFFTQDSNSPEFSIGACCTIINDNKKLILFGGWNMGVLTNKIYELDLPTLRWVELEPVSSANRPIAKNKAGIVPYGNEMVFIFGGYGYPYVNQQLQKDAEYKWDDGENHGWTNEQHLFHIIDKKWIVPETTGVRPPPCAGFTINRIDPFRVALFGGRQKLERVNEMYLLDMATWHWCSIMPPGIDHPWPSKRSFHTASSLFDPDYVPVKEVSSVDRFNWLPCEPPNLITHKPMNIIKEQQLLVLWGMDNNSDPVSDDMAWVLCLSSMEWKKVELPGGCVPRLWHATDTYYPSPLRCMVVTHGGVTENLFAKGDAETAVTNQTVILNYGVVSLYELCQVNVLQTVKAVTMLRTLLPERILCQLTAFKHL